MKLADIQAMMDVDTEIDLTKLDHDSANTPKLVTKYYRILIEEEKHLESLKIKMNVVKKNLFEYYMGLSCDEIYRERPLNRKPIKADIDIYINSDESMSVIQANVKSQQLKVKMIEDFIKLLNSRGFTIKNINDFNKFKSGGY